MKGSQFGLTRLSRSTLGPEPVSKPLLIGCMSDAVQPRIIETSFFFFVNEVTLSGSSNAQISAYGSWCSSRLSTGLVFGGSWSVPLLLSKVYLSTSLSLGGIRTLPIFFSDRT